MANRLINATSPYLLQHAHNPVDWFEWGPEALSKAAEEDKPILVSIGYSSCHWCHVMERESFEKDDIAEVMNKYFVCIKVDREERPDIDQIYMDAVHILGVQGGWPLNVFLTPDQKPFFGGTYFSPQVWVEILNNINKAYEANRQQIEDTAEELRTHLLASEVDRYKQKPVDSDFIRDLTNTYELLQAKFDRKWGGMDKQPKFIMPSVWMLLLRLSHITQNQAAFDHVFFTLKKIAAGGIYDQIGGGFCRYSVDRYWFAPHFEKMLYDNAQLLSLYSEAYAITKDERFQKVVYETFEWLMREMTHEAGGFYSALDADSEGIEGKYYVWTREELKELLQEDEPLISAYFSIKDEGNWEHGQNILMRIKDDESFIKDAGLSTEQWQQIFQRSKSKMLQQRELRIKPGLDDKIITAWNAMTICGLTDAYRAFGDELFLKAAEANARFIEEKLTEEKTLYRSFKGKRSNTKGFLDDYAFYIQALIRLYQVTFSEHHLRRAETLLEHTLDQFLDKADGYFFYTASGSEKLITRKKEIFDNVIPSSNAVMAQNLSHLGTLLDRDDWKQLAVAMTDGFSHLIKGEPGFMSQWGIVYMELKKGLAEIALRGKNISELRKELGEHYIPFSIIQGSENGSELPLLRDKVAGEHGTIYVCYNKTCKLPVHTVPDALKQL